MVVKNKHCSRTDDQVRQLMLEYFYERNREATSLLAKGKGAAVMISVLKKDLKDAHGLKRQQVVSNLTYLLSQGWVEEKAIAKSFSTPRGGIVPAVTKYYIITAAGIDKIAGPSSFMRDRFEGIRIEATGQNIITLGDGNRVNVRFERLCRNLSDLRDAIKESDSIEESTKLAVVADINCLQDQLASPQPNKEVISMLWKAIERTATIAGVVDAAASVAALIAVVL